MRTKMVPIFGATLYNYCWQWECWRDVEKMGMKYWTGNGMGIIPRKWEQ